jgi:NAD(P)-dependent dehydrogenase (short-subunit alcohol dehydrogenase family)
LITGSSRGLGAALLEWLSQEGAAVLGVGRSAPHEMPQGVKFLSLDLSKRENVAILVSEAKKFRVDTIVHCLGGGFQRSSDLISADDFAYLMQLNFTVSLELNNALLPMMIEQQRGWIVHLGSIATREVTASVGYTCVKSLIAPYVKHMGRKFLPYGVYISGITLGAITGFSGSMDRLHDQRPEVFTTFLETRRPTKRVTPVEELVPYFDLLLSSNAKVHASNMIQLDEAEGRSI